MEQAPKLPDFTARPITFTSGAKLPKDEPSRRRGPLPGHGKVAQVIRRALTKDALTLPALWKEVQVLWEKKWGTKGPSRSQFFAALKQMKKSGEVFKDRKGLLHKRGYISFST